MRFVKLQPQAGTRHALGMHEPEGHEYLSARFLDTIFVPAVALDRRGARLGHGSASTIARSTSGSSATIGGDHGSWVSPILSRSCRRFP